MAAYSWWSTFGGCIPDLQHVALKIFGQV